jgi:outer membrane protein OmpA-like peptidoglycan-associated protein
MKFGRALAMGIALSALSAASSYAQTVGSDEPYTGPNGPYIRGEGGWSWENPMKGQGSTNLNFNSTEESGYVVGGAAGWKFGQLRAELGLDFSGHGVQTLGVNQDGGLGARLHVASLSGVSSNPTGDVHIWSGMANAYWDFRTGTPFVPYIGIGVGVAHVSVDNFGVRGTVIANSSDNVFAYQPMVGVRYHITDAVAIGAEYRYFATVDPTLKDASGVKFHGRIESHNVLANLSYFFGAPPAPPVAAQPAATVAPAPAPRPAAPVSINPSAGAAVATSATQTFVVYFDTGRATLTPQGRRVADDAIAAFKSSNASHVAIAGFTDTVGDARANEALSRRRADTVRNYLVAHGVPLSEMAVGWHGESDLRVATGNGVPDQQNRRVEINIP